MMHWRLRYSSPRLAILRILWIQDDTAFEATHLSQYREWVGLNKKFEVSIDLPQACNIA